MKELSRITPHIHRLVIPYKDIFTTVVIIDTPEGTVLVDAASYSEDIDNYILPALKELGCSQIRYVVISHNHTDHAGGLHRLMEVFPNACILSRHPEIKEKYPTHRVLSPEDSATFAQVLRIYTVPGHTADSIAVLDTRTKLMFTGDSLQLYGIYGSGAWGANISYPVAHRKAVEKLQGLDIDTILTAHNYHPCGHLSQGKDAVCHCLNICIEALDKIREAIIAQPELNDDALAESYNRNSGLPTVHRRVFAAMRAAMKDDSL